jgi:hypothetical protein
MSRPTRIILDGLTAASVVVFLFFSLLVAQRHPLLVARRDRLWVYVPYWGMARPPEVFDTGWPTTARVDVKGAELYFVSVSDGRHTHWNLWIDGWLPATLAALLPAGRAVRWWVRRRRRTRERGERGTCGVCGYDLRASTDRCPECGTAITAKGAA